MSLLKRSAPLKRSLLYSPGTIGKVSWRQTHNYWRLHTDLAAESGSIIHVGVVLEARKKQDWGGHGVLSYGFGDWLRLTVVWQGQTPFKEALKGHFLKLLKVKSKLQWRPYNIGDSRTVGCLPRRAMYMELHCLKGERCVLQATEMERWGRLPQPLEA